MNISRRNLLRGGAAVGVGAGLVAVPDIIRAGEPDNATHIEALIAEHKRTKARYRKAVASAERAEAELERQLPYPASCTYRRPHPWRGPEAFEIEYLGRSDLKSFYHQHTEDSLWTSTGGDMVIAAIHARYHEVLADLDAYEARCKTVRARAKGPGLRREASKLLDRLDVLLDRIANTPATSARGVLAKQRFMARTSPAKVGRAIQADLERLAGRAS